MNWCVSHKWTLRGTPSSIAPPRRGEPDLFSRFGSPHPPACARRGVLQYSPRARRASALSVKANGSDAAAWPSTASWCDSPPGPGPGADPASGDMRGCCIGCTGAGRAAAWNGKPACCCCGAWCCGGSGSDWCVSPLDVGTAAPPRRAASSLSRFASPASNTALAAAGSIIVAKTSSASKSTARCKHPSGRHSQWVNGASVLCGVGQQQVTCAGEGGTRTSGPWKK